MSEKLIRNLKLGGAISMVVGTIVGSAVFLVAAEVTRQIPTAGMGLLVWLTAGVVSLMGGLTFAELGAAYPGAGGPYLYFSQAFTPLIGYLYGWTLAILVQPGSIAAEAAGLAQFAPYLIPLTPLQAKLTASGVIVLFTMVNLLDYRTGTKFLNRTTTVKILALLFLGGAGVWLKGSVAVFPAHSSVFTGVTATSFGIALIAAFWSYDGWNALCFVGGEVENPKRNLPRGMAIGIMLVTALYLLINYAYYRFLTVGEIANSEFPAGQVAWVMGGNWALAILMGVVVLSTLNCTNATVFSSGRLAFAMAERGDLPSWLAYVHPKFHVPTNALLFQMLLTLLMLWSGTFVQLFTCVVAVAFFFYGLSAVALLVLRFRFKAKDRPYGVWGYPFTPILYLLFCGAFVVNTVTQKPLESLWGMGLVLVGIPFFYWQKKNLNRG